MRISDWSSDVCSSDLQRGGDDADPGDELADAGPRLVGDAVEVARRARELVEHRRAVDEVARREDQRRVARPEEDETEDILGTHSGLAHHLAMGGEPLADQRFHERAGFGAGRTDTSRVGKEWSSTVSTRW